MSASLSDWKALYQSLLVGLQIRNILSFEDEPTLMEISNSIDNSTLEDLASEILRLIDFDANLEGGRVRVKFGVSSELDVLRNSYENLDDALDSYWSRMLPKFVNVPASKLSYFPQLGFLIIIPLPPGEELQQTTLISLSNDYGLEYQVLFIEFYVPFTLLPRSF